jgi:hypothetical protein
MKMPNRFVVVLMSCGCLVVLVSGYFAIAPAYQAKRFLAELGPVLESRSGEELVSLIQRFGGRTEPIVENEKVVRAEFRNKLLSTLRLAPQTKLSAMVYVNNREVKYFAISYSVGRTDLVADVGILNFLAAKNEPPSSVDEFGIQNKSRIKLTYNASPEFRRDAYGLEAACLYRLSGCRTVDQLLPSYGRLEKK